MVKSRFIAVMSRKFSQATSSPRNENFRRNFCYAHAWSATVSAGPVAATEFLSRATASCWSTHFHCHRNNRRIRASELFHCARGYLGTEDRYEERMADKDLCSAYIADIRTSYNNWSGLPGRLW